jgi:hypothetical protein
MIDPKFLKMVTARLESGKLDGEVRRILVKALSAKSVEEASGLLDVIEQIVQLAPSFADLVGRVVAGVRSTKLDDLVKNSTASGEVPGARKRRPAAMTPKRRAALKVQGRYLGLLRKFAGKERARIKAVAKSKGTAAATRTMEKALAKAAKR